MQRQHLVLLLLTFLFSCSLPESDKQARERQEKEIMESKYVYMDIDSTIHADLDCYVIGSKIVNSEYTDTGQGVRRILKTDLTSGILDRCCRNCVTDERYDLIKENIPKGKKAPWVK